MTTDTIEQDAPATEASVFTEIKALAVPDVGGMTKTASAALRMAQSFTITSQDDYALAGEELQSVKGRIKKMEEARTSITGPMNKALDAINNLFRGPMNTLKSAEAALKQSMITYHDEQERIAAEARRKAEQEAAAERARIAEEARKVEAAAAAERKRIADEAAEVAAKAKAEQDRLAKQAREAEEAGNAAAAEEARAKAEAARTEAALQAQQAEQRDIEVSTAANESAASLRLVSSVASAPVETAAPVKASGTSVKATVEFEITSLLSLVQHVAKNPELIGLIAADTVKVRAYVRGLGLNTNLPGVRVYEKRSLAAKSA